VGKSFTFIFDWFLFLEWKFWVCIVDSFERKYCARWAWELDFCNSIWRFLVLISVFMVILFEMVDFRVSHSSLKTLKTRNIECLELWDYETWRWFWRGRLKPWAPKSRLYVYRYAAQVGNWKGARFSVSWRQIVSVPQNLALPCLPISWHSTIFCFLPLFLDLNSCISVVIVIDTLSLGCILFLSSSYTYSLLSCVLLIYKRNFCGFNTQKSNNYLMILQLAQILLPTTSHWTIYIRKQKLWLDIMMSSCL
jgi:hypothetical protein